MTLDEAREILAQQAKAQESWCQRIRVWPVAGNYFACAEPTKGNILQAVAKTPQDAVHALREKLFTY